MKLSFDDKESFMEAAGSLRFNDPPSNPNTTHQQVPVGPRERSGDIGINYPSNDPNTLALQGVGRNTSSSQDLGEE